MADSKRRFNLKPYRSHQPMDMNDAVRTWDVIANAIDEIYNRNASQLSFEELYRKAYNLVLHKHGSLLYEGITDKLTGHLLATVDALTNHPTNEGSVSAPSLLEEISNSWNEHCITMIMIRDILMYMDRTYVQQSKRRTVYELGLHLFRITVWEHYSIKQRVIELLLDAIQKERSGWYMADNRELYKSVIAMLLELGRADYTAAVYQQDFEQIFLGTTQEYYHTESLQYLSSATAIQYVQKATRRLQEEKERAIALQFPITTEGPLLTIVQTEWIERHAQQLVDMESTGFAALLKQGTEEDNKSLMEMQQMYDLFSRVPSSVEHLRDALSERIKADGKKLIADQENSSSNNNNGSGGNSTNNANASDPASFVRGVLNMRIKYDTIVQITFRNEKKTQKRMKESFEDFLNIDARAASCLAIYVDELLRMGIRGYTEEQIANELNKVIIIFRYLSDKDVFESFYKQHLAKRLLGGRSISDDAERSMVSLLKAECGYQFTTKLEGMFNDMRISRETRDKYKEYNKKQGYNNNNNNNGSNHQAGKGGAKQLKTDKSATASSVTASAKGAADAAAAAAAAATTIVPPFVDIEVDVLTTGYWPSQKVPPCTLPIEIQHAIDRFSTFYLETHTGRKLQWQTSAGAAELRATFIGTTTTTTSGKQQQIRKHELCVSTYQMCILLLFNTQDTLTLGQIRTQTHIPDMELRRHLISLCTPKNRILKKGSKGKGITSDDDTFTYNADYTSKLKRVRIPLVKETSIMRTDGTAGAGSAAAGAAAGGGGADALGVVRAGGVGMGGGGGSGSGFSGRTSSSMMLFDGSIPENVEEDRRHLVEASIVRIMKARKRLNHNDLIAEVTKQLSIRFTPLPTFIKKRIESLIEREYLERSEEESRVYNYVA